ncbi:MAG: 16S rRNA (uracil(1498)-N(3))-methyltransferase [Gammaproteobacteria bacterium]|nr:16S rRNA (uracil(1498)-N(3))-methyltransferase [Gammaproteobacteria bacterium]NNM11139.1 16S rRNA (uracil(1498)-N(3))-methyltransferase [Pseudomonadales bacterium]
MNLLLLDRNELPAAHTAGHGNAGHTLITLRDARATHIVEVLRATAGDSLKAGIINGQIGRATINNIELASNAVTIETDTHAFTQPPPVPLNCRVFVALPRPKAARRILRLLAELGVKEIHVFNCYKVEKSYWSSPLLKPAQVNQQFKLGLSQSVDTLMPVLHQQRLFRPFVEDVLPGLINGEMLLLAQPGSALSAKQALRGQVAEDTINIVIGPEGGLIPYEVNKLVEAGAREMSLGSRIFRSEVALVQLLAEVRGFLSEY